MHFCVTLPTFDALCALVWRDLQKQHTRMCSPVSVDERVAIAPWILATGDRLKSFGLQFGTVISTAKTTCAEFKLCDLNLFMLALGILESYMMPGC